jgi:outer membrane receptor protein involved in Fe transport
MVWLLIEKYISNSVRIFLFILFFSVYSSLYSQNKGAFVGIVQDVISGEPIIGAHLKAFQESNLGGVSTVTGEFAIECPVGTHRFIISSLGYITDTITILVDKDIITKRVVMLRQENSILDEVQITAGKFDTNIEELTYSLVVIKPDLIENKNTRSIETVLDQTPGLNILDGEPQIRGGSGFTFGVGSKVAILVDDMPLLSGDAGRPEWGFVPVENIEQIEVVKGAASVLSGASALSGAIHIRTANPTSKPKTKINLYSGFYSAPSDTSMKWWSDYPYITGMNFFHARKIKQLDFTVGGILNFDHGYIGAPQTSFDAVDTITNFDDKAMRSEKARMNVNLRYHPKNIENLTFGVNVNAMYHNTNLPLAWLDDTSGIYRAYPGGVILQRQLIYNIDPYVNYFTKKGMKHSLKLRNLVTDNEMSSNQSNWSSVFFGDYQMKHNFKKFRGLQLVSGLSASQARSVAQLYEASGMPENRLNNVSAYAQSDMKIKENLSFSLGYRLEYYQLNNLQADWATIMRGGLNYRITEGTHFRASYGQGYRYPTIAERFIKTTVGTFGVFDNPDLQPETSWNMEVALFQGYKLGRLQGFLDIALFEQHNENTIEYLFGFWDSTYTFALAGFKFLNTGRSKVKGVDISTSGVYKIDKKTKLTYVIGYNYILPTTVDPNKIFARDYRPGGSGEFSYNSTSIDSSQLILKYRFLHTFKSDIDFVWKEKISLGTSIRFFSRIVNLDRAIIDFEEATLNSGGSTQAILYSAFFANKNNGNWIADVRMGFQVNEHQKLSLVINNLFNRTYSLRPLKIEPLRTVMLQYSLTF